MEDIVKKWEKITGEINSFKNKLEEIASKLDSGFYLKDFCDNYRYLLRPSEYAKSRRVEKKPVG